VNMKTMRPLVRIPSQGRQKDVPMPEDMVMEIWPLVSNIANESSLYNMTTVYNLLSLSD